MKKGVLWTIVGGLVIIAGVSVYVYTQRPSRVVSNAIGKLAQAETSRFTAEIALAQTPAAQALLSEATALNITLNGSFDRRGAERDSVASHIAVSAKSESVSLDLNGELRLVGDQAYLLVQTAPNAIPLLAALKDTWVELPRGGQVAAATTAPSGPLFQSIRKQGREEIHDRSTIKYEAVATEQGVLALMNNIAGMLGTALTDDQLGQLRSNLAGLQNLPVTLWVTPFSHELVQLQAQLPDGAVRYTLSFSDRNQPVDHAIPEGAKPINEVLQPQS